MKRWVFRVVMCLPMLLALVIAVLSVLADDFYWWYVRTDERLKAVAGLEPKA